MKRKKPLRRKTPMRRRGKSTAGDLAEFVRVARAVMPTTVDVLERAAVAAAGAVNQAAIDELGRLDAQLAGKLVALIQEKAGRPKTG